MNTESADALVQSSRDQGIADACAGRAPYAWFETNGQLFVRDSVIPPASRVFEGEPDYRSAFAYARAFEQNRIESKGENK